VSKLNHYMAQTSLSAFFAYCQSKKLPMAFYRLPHQSEVEVVAQKNPVVRKVFPGTAHIYEQGFLMAPFVENQFSTKIFIQPDVYTTADNLPPLNFALQILEYTEDKQKAKKRFANKVQFKKSIKQIRKKIKAGWFKKIVAARVIKHTKPLNFDEIKFFETLCKKYPTAFVSLVSSQEYGTWIGASPEVLLQVNEQGFTTYSLAGTMANTAWNEKVGWGEKEQVEQNLVSEYILQSLEQITKDTPEITGPDTIVAGNLLHLCTSFTYKNVPHFNWQKAVDVLHPTPAVAGLPKNEAVNYILQNELSPRSYYSGYLGPVNLDGEINLFVNLRCMQVTKKNLMLYVGCGVTSDSKPSKEWKETKIKAETLLSVLKETPQKLKVSKSFTTLLTDEHREKNSAPVSATLQAEGNS